MNITFNAWLQMCQQYMGYCFYTPVYYLFRKPSFAFINSNIFNSKKPMPHMVIILPFVGIMYVMSVSYRQVGHATHMDPFNLAL